MPPKSFYFNIGTIALSVIALILMMMHGLLAGLLAGLAAYTLTKWIAGHPRLKAYQAFARIGSATGVILLPLVLFGFLGVYASQFIGEALLNYAGLVEHITGVILEWRGRVPVALMAFIPEEAEALQDWVTQLAKTNGPLLAGVGKTWAHGSLMAFVGIVAGALIAISEVQPSSGPLAVALCDRARVLALSFKKIVLAQFWIAGINAFLTAIFLLLLLPAFDVEVPFSGWLVVLTFVAGMIPIVGNLLCNVVITIAGLGVGPHVALMCLAFLIGIHKLEYFINAKVVGASISTAAWELLIAMFVMESIFGVAGLVAAPLYYAWLKLEMKTLNWV